MRTSSRIARSTESRGSAVMAEAVHRKATATPVIAMRSWRVILTLTGAIAARPDLKVAALADCFLSRWIRTKLVWASGARKRTD